MSSSASLQYRATGGSCPQPWVYFPPDSAHLHQRLCLYLPGVQTPGPLTFYLQS